MGRDPWDPGPHSDCAGGGGILVPGRVSTSKRPHQAHGTAQCPTDGMPAGRREQKVPEAAPLGGKAHHWAWCVRVYCVHVCTCVHVCVVVCARVGMHMCIDVCAVHVCVYVHACVYTCVRVCAALAHSQALAPGGTAARRRGCSVCTESPGCGARGLLLNPWEPQFPHHRPLYWRSHKWCPAGQPPLGRRLSPVPRMLPASAPKAQVPGNSSESRQWDGHARQPPPPPARGGRSQGAQQAGLSCE